MRPFYRPLLTVLVLAAMPWGAGAQTLYKSVGADGRVVYSDKPPVTGAVEKTMKLENLPVSVVPGASPAPAKRASAPGDPGGPLVIAAPPSGVVLFTASWCGYCKAAKAYLNQKNIAYRELDVDTPIGKTAFADIGGRSVPLLIAPRQRITGFTAQAYDSAFAARQQ
jgi:glutaredoxin